MRAVIQRAKDAKVEVNGRVTGSIEHGLVVLLGVHKDDTEKDIKWLSDKIVNLRIFDDAAGHLNRSLADTGGEMLIISQFTLLGDCRKGRRPSWSSSAPPDRANEFYEAFIRSVQEKGIKTATGVFQAMMDVTLTNAGPVTLILDSHKK